MPRRKQSKKVEESAISYVESLMNGVNWQTNRLYRDFGIDLHVKIFDNDEDGMATPWEFYVQVKGRSSVRVINGAVSVQIDHDHLRLWSQASLPVVLVLFDVSKAVAYWLGIRSYFRKCQRTISEPQRSDSVSLRIPIESVLSQATFGELRRHVRDEILYLNAQTVVSTIRWWAVMHDSATRLGLWSAEEAMLPIDPAELPPLAFPEENLTRPVLGYCWGCGNVWWLDERETWLEAVDEGDEEEYLYPLMFVGQSPQPDAHYVDPDACPKCCKGEGRLNLCVRCGTPFFPLEEEYQSQEEWEKRSSDDAVPVSYEEAKELCGDCTRCLWKARVATAGPEEGQK